MLHGVGTIVIEPSGDDGAESVDEEGGFVVAGRVIGCCLEVCAELLGIVFDGVKKPREVIGGYFNAANGEDLSALCRTCEFGKTRHGIMIGKCHRKKSLALCLVDQLTGVIDPSEQRE